jgi:hypothetical protein
MLHRLRKYSEIDISFCSINSLDENFQDKKNRFMEVKSKFRNHTVIGETYFSTKDNPIIEMTILCSKDNFHEVKSIILELDIDKISIDGKCSSIDILKKF